MRVNIGIHLGGILKPTWHWGFTLSIKCVYVISVSATCPNMSPQKNQWYLDYRHHGDLPPGKLLHAVALENDHLQA